MLRIPRNDQDVTSPERVPEMTVSSPIRSLVIKMVVGGGAAQGACSSTNRTLPSPEEISVLMID
jgi:hypothetical protein